MVSRKLIRISITFILIGAYSFMFGQDEKSFFLNELKKGLIEYNSDIEQLLLHNINIYSTSSQINNPVMRKAFEASSNNEKVYILATNSEITIVGENSKAIQNGFSLYLNHLGFRYYFPNSNWHHIPKLNSAFKNFELLTEPSYINRRIWYGYGTGSKKADADFNHWKNTNNMNLGIPGSVGHIYYSIISRNKDVFKQHPEYLAKDQYKNNRIPKTAKFNVGNNDLVELVKKDALKRAQKAYARYGDVFMISMDPSDGGGHCQRPECLEVGTASDQVFYLANEVAKELKKHFPKAYVALYAYYAHSAPPIFDLEDNIIIYLATAYNTSKYTYDELLQLWADKATLVGIRGYLGVVAWDWDQPGKGRATKPISVAEEIKKQYNNKARLYSAETLNGWITKGLGHYIAAKTLWDINTNAEEEIDHFYKTMFPTTTQEMRKVHEEILNYERTKIIDRDLNNWFTIPWQAYEESSNIEEKARIKDLVTYIYSILVYKQYQENNPKFNITRLFEDYGSINDQSLVATYAIRRRLYSKFRKQNPDLTRSKALQVKRQNEISLKYIRNEILNNTNPLQWTSLDADNFTFSPNIENKEFKEFNTWRLRNTHVFLVQKSSNSLLKLNSGYVKTHVKNGVRVDFYKKSDEKLANSLYSQQTIQGEQSKVNLEKIPDGIYWMKISGANEGFRIMERKYMKLAIRNDSRYPIWTLGRNNFYFYVPPGTKNIIVRRGGPGVITAPDGSKLDLKTNKKASIEIPIKANQHGIWKIGGQSNRIMIDGIPPFMAQRVDDLPIKTKP